MSRRMRRRRQGRHRDRACTTATTPIAIRGCKRRPVARAGLHRGRAAEARAGRAARAPNFVCRGRISCANALRLARKAAAKLTCHGARNQGQFQARSGAARCRRGGDIEGDAEQSARGARPCRRCRRPILIAFTELYLTGYPIEDLVLKPACRRPRAKPARRLPRRYGRRRARHSHGAAMGRSAVRL